MYSLYTGSTHNNTKLHKTKPRVLSIKDLKLFTELTIKTGKLFQSLINLLKIIRFAIQP